MAAIDQNYLYVKNPSWQRLRTSLLVDTEVTVSSLDRQLTALHDDGDLRIVTNIASLVLISGAKLALLGCGLGVISSLAISRMVSAFLFDVSATDPLIYAASIALMLLGGIAGVSTAGNTSGVGRSYQCAASGLEPVINFG